MFEIIRTCELTKPPETYTLHGQFFTEDNIGQKLGFAVVKNGAAQTLTGYSVTANVIRADFVTVVISSGTISDNLVTVVLPESALAINGPCVVHIRITNGDTKITLGEFAFPVKLNSSDTIVDPGHVIPSIEELLAQIAVMEEAIDRADAASALCEDMTVSATAASGTTPTVTKTTVGGHYNLQFGLVPASISSQVTKYKVDDSGTTIPSSGWQDTVPTVPQGKYLWTQHTITWNNAQTSVLYSVSRQGIDGQGAVNTVNGVSPDSNGNVELPVDASPTASSTNLVQSGGVKSAIDTHFPVSVAEGGTGGTTAATARTGLGVAQKPITVNFGTITEFPFTVEAAGITADMIPIAWDLDEDAFNSDLTVTTGAGTVTINGSLRSGYTSTVKITFSEAEAE